MRAVILSLTALVGAAACGDAAPPRPPTTTTRALPALDATAAGPDDLIVARVGGRPVWGSCVAAQARAHGRTRQAALDECIALELAAQEAERRGLHHDPDVGEEVTRALAAALVDREFAARYRTPADLPAYLTEGALRRFEIRMHRPELRYSFFARIELKAPAGSPEDLAAGAAARAAHATLAGRRDLFPQDVEAALRAAAGPDMKVGTGAPERVHREGLQAYYADPLFALPGVGAVTAPVRGPYGWDLILMTGHTEPREMTRDELLAEVFGALRIRWFQDWSAQLGKGHTVERLADDDTLRVVLGAEEPAP